MSTPTSMRPRIWDYITDLYSASRSLIAMDAYCVCGHIHVPALYHMSQTGKVASFEPVGGIEIPLSRHRRWLAVLGAVGQPRDGNWRLATQSSRRRETLSYMRVPYDIDGAAQDPRRRAPGTARRRLYEDAEGTDRARTTSSEARRRHRSSGRAALGGRRQRGRLPSREPSSDWRHGWFLARYVIPILRCR